MHKSEKRCGKQYLKTVASVGKCVNDRAPKQSFFKYGSENNGFNESQSELKLYK